MPIFKPDNDDAEITFKTDNDVAEIICLDSGKSLNPPASEESREVANLTDSKNPHTHVYGFKESVCLSTNLHQWSQDWLNSCDIYGKIPYFFNLLFWKMLSTKYEFLYVRALLLYYRNNF